MGNKLLKAFDKQLNKAKKLDFAKTYKKRGST